MIEITNEEFLFLKKYLYNTCGIDIPKEKSYLFQTRLGELISEGKFKSYADLYNHLKIKKNKKLHRKIIEVMTTNETSFFRDEHPFETIKNTILPELINDKLAKARFSLPKLRVWSAACSTGQEPYSLAMMIFDWIKEQSALAYQNVTILATDISVPALEKGQSGIYNEEEVQKGLNNIHSEKYFSKKNEKYIIDKKVKDMVTFFELNLSESFSDLVGTWDIILCRNVIIYFHSELKKKITDQFAKILKPGGVLILGASETLYNISDKFAVFYDGPSIYYKVKK
jgi:chemotaxis protein methyltransferase CheR